MSQNWLYGADHGQGRNVSYYSSPQFSAAAPIHPFEELSGDRRRIADDSSSRIPVARMHDGVAVVCEGSDLPIEAGIVSAQANDEKCVARLVNQLR